MEQQSGTFDPSTSASQRTIEAGGRTVSVMINTSDNDRRAWSDLEQCEVRVSPKTFKNQTQLTPERKNPLARCSKGRTHHDRSRRHRHDGGRGPEPCGDIDRIDLTGESYMYEYERPGLSGGNVSPRRSVRFNAAVVIDGRLLVRALRSSGTCGRDSLE
jgi:hypothetical protein